MNELDDWFRTIAGNCEVASDAVQQLHDNGFVMIPGPVVPAELPQLVLAYEAALLAGQWSASSSCLMSFGLIENDHFVEDESL
jgi:hypothetical protein